MTYTGTPWHGTDPNVYGRHNGTGHCQLRKHQHQVGREDETPLYLIREYEVL